MKKIQDVKLKDKRVILRVDFNVPIDEFGNILDINRIVRVLPTIRLLKSKGAKIIILSHLGRPQGYDKSLSLVQLLPTLRGVYNSDLEFCEDYSSAVEKSKILGRGDILLLENLRFHKEEENNDPIWAKSLAEIGDIYVNDAFACCHRGHASIDAITEFIPSYAGLLLQEELMHLESALKSNNSPRIAIVGGKKVSTKYKILESLCGYVDFFILTGGMANTFLAATGHNVGDSFVEDDFMVKSGEFIKSLGKDKVFLPSDFAILRDEAVKIVNLDELRKGDVICDIGPETMSNIYNVINQAKTVLWNGPVGIYEDHRFCTGSDMIARIIAKNTERGDLHSVVGGGDLLAVLSKNCLKDSFSYVSTGGGAFLEWLSGDEMPGISALNR
jgi:phosphoglycerate kinase